MVRLLLATALIFASFNAPASAADIGVSVSIGEPGFYGRLDMGDYQSPQLIYRQPRVIGHIERRGDPIYLRVPPGHARNWSKHCSEYNACDEQVYFVQDGWYNREYAPRYQEQHRSDFRGDHHNESRERDGNAHGKGHQNQDEHKNQKQNDRGR